MATFGYTTQGTTGATMVDGTIMGGHAAPTVDGLVDSISAYIIVTTNPHKMKAALYTYVGPGNAGTFIQGTEQRTIAVGALRWETWNFTPPRPYIVAGTQYWILIWAETLLGNASVAYDAGGPAGHDLWVTVAYDGWPSPLAGENPSNSMRSIYATYSPTGVSGGAGKGPSQVLTLTMWKKLIPEAILSVVGRR